MSTNLTEQTDTRTAPNDSDDEYNHDVSNIEAFRCFILRRVPHARCGLLLIAEPGKSYPGPGEAPLCPKCIIERAL